jgi:hypothetical protein
MDVARTALDLHLAAKHIELAQADVIVPQSGDVVHPIERAMTVVLASKEDGDAPFNENTVVAQFNGAAHRRVILLLAPVSSYQPGLMSLTHPRFTCTCFSTRCTPLAEPDGTVAAA